MFFECLNLHACSKNVSQRCSKPFVSSQILENKRKCGSGFGVLVKICCVEGTLVLEGVKHIAYERSICF